MGVFTDRDPTDLGLPWLPDDDEPTEPLRHVRDVDPGPCATPADPSRIAELVAEVRAERGWSGRNPLRHPCEGCGADTGRWCRRGRRGSVSGHVCAARRVGTPE